MPGPTARSYRVEVRFDVAGTEAAARAAAAEAVNSLADVGANADVGAIFDDDWNEL